MAPAYTLAYLRIFVRDWPRALAVQLALERAAPDDEEGERLVGRFVGASLAVDDVNATYERLRARGVSFVAPPERMPWGGVLAHFRDPDGNVLTLLESAPGA